MKKIVGVLILFLAGSLVVGCGSDANASNSMIQESSIGIVGGCEMAKGTAVSLTVIDKNGNMPIKGVKIRYQVNGGNWNEFDPITTNPIPIEGSSGQYNIEVRLADHPLQTAVVFVPQDESCSVLQQDVLIKLRSPLNCPNPPETIVMNVVQPPSEGIEGVNINVISPSEMQENSQCNGGVCAFNIHSMQTGVYEVTLDGFQDRRIMNLDNGIIRYTYPNVEIDLVVNQRVHKIVTEGVDNIGLKIPYNYRDDGCLGVDFEEIVPNRRHYQTPASNIIETIEKQSLRIADLSSEYCTRVQVDTTVEYNVLVPAGTEENSILVHYWLSNEWVKAECDYSDIDKEYICTADYKNPLLGDKYNIRTTINNEEFFGSYISLDNKCIYFE